MRLLPAIRFCCRIYWFSWCCWQQTQGQPRNKDQFILRMDFNESDSSQWFGRYSWGDENQLSEGLKLNGFQVLTNVEQYMGSNVRTFSPST